MTEGFMTNLQNRKWQEVPVQNFVFHCLCIARLTLSNELLSNDQCCCLVEVGLHHWSAVTVHGIDLEVDSETQRKATAASNVVCVPLMETEEKHCILLLKGILLVVSLLLLSAVGLKCLRLGLLLVPVVLLKSAVSIESKHEVTILSGLNEFVVKFHGPAGSKNLSLSLCIFCSDSCALYWFGLSWSWSISVSRSFHVTSSCLWRWCLESASGPTREISLQITINRSEILVRMKSQLYFVLHNV